MCLQRMLATTRMASSSWRRISRAAPAVTRSCDVFINHRGADTKHTLGGLLHYRLQQLGANPFLDSKSMQPGDKLFETIGSAIRSCKVGVVVFSPRYCESYFCLLELALLVEMRKKIIPIFCDVKPSEIEFMELDKSTLKEQLRFRRALQEARYTVGLVFDSQNGYGLTRILLGSKHLSRLMGE